MTSFRRAIPDFQTANPLYVGAEILIYAVDEDGNSTGELATLYAAPRGTQTLANPQTLDGDGKWERVPYFDVPIQMRVVSTRVESHSTGVVQPFGNWRGTWETGTTYLACDFMQYGDADFPNIYAVSDSYTSRATIEADIASGDLVLIVDCQALVDMRDAQQEFAVLYLGAKTSSVSTPLPTVDNDGATLLAGALLYHTNVARFKVWSGVAWIDPAVLSHTHAISDVTSLQASLDAFSTAIFNLGNAQTSEASARSSADTAIVNNMGLVKISTGNQSNVAAVDIALPSDYDSFHLVVHSVKPLLAAAVNCRFGFPAIQVTGYGNCFTSFNGRIGTWSNISADLGNVFGPNQPITLIGSTGAADGAGSGYVDIENRPSIGNPQMRARFTSRDGAYLDMNDSCGEHPAAFAAITVFRLYASSGNINCKWTLYGRKR